MLIDMSLPFGSTKDFVSEPSVQGFSFDARYFLTKNVGIGVGAGFDTLSQKSEGTFTWENIATTGVATRELSFTPLQFKGIYALRDKPQYAPYFAVAMGAGRVARRVFSGISSYSDRAWMFCVTPEIGTHVSVSRATFVASLRLHHLPQAGGLPAQTIGNLSLGVSVQ